MIGLSSIVLQKTWNTFTLSNIYILMHTNTVAAFLFLKICNFHCTRRSKNWEFQILQIIYFLKTKKMIPECQDLFRLLICASWSCIGVSWTCRDIVMIIFWIYIPPPPPPPPTLKKDGSSKICWKSHFSKSIFLLVLMALKWSLRSLLSFCSKV